jgi:nucleoside-triphosphatase THEP1
MSGEEEGHTGCSRILLTGSPGGGKTTVLRRLIACRRSRNSALAMIT